MLELLETELPYSPSIGTWNPSSIEALWRFEDESDAFKLHKWGGCDILPELKKDEIGFFQQTSTLARKAGEYIGEVSYREIEPCETRVFEAPILEFSIYKRK